MNKQAVINWGFYIGVFLLTIVLLTLIMFVFFYFFGEQVFSQPSINEAAEAAWFRNS